jgi:branched-subunit amino acid permease
MAFESQARSYIIKLYAIAESDQKYKLAMPFAEHNFGPFGRIFIAIFLFESCIISNTSHVCVDCLYFRACIFKFAPFSFITVYKNSHFWLACVQP